jgi:MFS family permease
MSLPAADAHRAMRLSLVEGACWALMVGLGETYFPANAVRLGASPFELGLVVGLPLCLGAAGPMTALALLRRARRRRPLVATTATAQAAVLISLAVLDALDRLGPRLLIAHVCAYQMFGMGSATMWSSWYGDLVPAHERGRYFARRNLRVQLSTLFAALLAGALLQLLEPRASEAAAATTTGGDGLGFRTIFAVAAVARLASVALLLRSPEPTFRGISGAARTLAFLGTERGRGAARLLALGAMIQFSAYIASPYFTPFMLTDMKLSYLQFTVATVTVMSVKSLFLPRWGRAVDLHGPRATYALCASMVALVPVPWLLYGAVPAGFAIAVAAQAYSGLSWAGYELSYFNVLLSSSYRRTRPQVFAAQNVFNGSAQLLGSLAGAALFGLMGRHFLLLFAASAAVRLSVAMLAPAWLPRAEEGVGRRELLLRVVGVRPAGGLAHRPVDAHDGEIDEGPGRG